MKRLIIKKYHSFLISILSVFLIIISLPSQFQQKYLVFFAYIPFFVLSDKNKKDYFFTLLIGFFTGLVIYFGFVNFDNKIYIYSSFLLALHFFCISYFYKKYGVFSGILSAVVFEIIRQTYILDFPSNIGLSLYSSNFLIFLSSFGGIYILTIVVLVVNYSVYNLIIGKNVYSSIICILLILFFSTFFCLHRSKSTSGEIRVALIQGGLPEWILEKKELTQIDKLFFMEKSYIDITEKAVNKKTDILLYPETTFNNKDITTNSFYRNIFMQSAIENGISVISGVEFFIKDKKYNSVVYMDSEKEIRYDKVRLVPIVEDKYAKGEFKNIIDTGDFKFLTSICFESIFDSHFFYSGANYNIIFIISSDLEYGSSFINYLHGAYSVFRAAETGVPVLRVSHSGLSFHVDHNGIIKEILPVFQQGYLNCNVMPKKNNTFYSQNYKYIVSGYIFLFILSLFIYKKQ